MLNLGVTRDANQLISLMQKADEKNIHIVPLPVTETTSLLHNENQIPNLTNFDWLFFTSANGVHTFLGQTNIDSLPHNIKIATVGAKTSDALIALGLDVHFQPSLSYGKNLFTEFVQKFKDNSLKVLYLRAETVVHDAKEFFEKSSIDYNELICYKTQEKVINKSEIDIFTNKDYILFTAPSTVSSFKNQFGTPIAKLIAIGNTTKEAIEKNNWKTHIVLDKPEIEKVLEYI